MFNLIKQKLNLFTAQLECKSENNRQSYQNSKYMLNSSQLPSKNFHFHTKKEKKLKRAELT